MAYLIAAASSTGQEVDRHFGHSEVFSILEVGDDNAYTVKERRTVPAPCQHGTHDPAAMAAAVAALLDCRYVLAEAIGRGASAALQARGVTPLETEETMPLAAAVQQVIAYEKRKHHIK
jgi:predicted Fe-Mo cluster-binding NifX family protein